MLRKKAKWHTCQPLLPLCCRAVVVPSAAGRKSTGASGVGWLMPRSSQKQKRRVLVRKSSTDSLLALGPVAEGAALAAGSRTGVSE
jgi:hypothetical protein